MTLTILAALKGGGGGGGGGGEGLREKERGSRLLTPYAAGG